MTETLSSNRYNPCKGCPDRYPACSAHCKKPEYLDWKEEQAAIKRNRDNTKLRFGHTAIATQGHRDSFRLPFGVVQPGIVRVEYDYPEVYNQNADQRTEVLWCNFEVPSLFRMEDI